MQVIGEAHWGASVWLVTGTQVPVLQLKQGSVQDSGQQTPSVQKSEAHSTVLLQTLPFGLSVGVAAPHEGVFEGSHHDAAGRRL